MAEPAAIKAIGFGFIAALIAAGWTTTAACSLVGVHRMSWHRHQRPPPAPGVQVPHRERAYPNRISLEEAEVFMTLLNSEAYEDLSVTQAYWRMLDAGEVFFSAASAHRITAAHGQNGDRRIQGKGGSSQRQKPVQSATAPNQLWSWDITMLRGPGRNAYRLYAVLDVFSRKIVGHRVEHSELAIHAKAMIDQAVGLNQGYPKVLHSDNGGPMRSATTVEFARSLGITLSFSRPRVSNDNPYSEAAFKTIKYHLNFPARFESIGHARGYLAAFVTDYNANHRHSGLNYYTPNDVHHGLAEQTRKKRQAHLNTYYSAHPERFPRKPLAARPPAHAGINTHEKPALSQTA
ncbi:MAG: IS3 family transposase [Actinomycetota bacterium]